MAIENINDYAGMWANGVNIGQMWDLIKAKFVSGFHNQSGSAYTQEWRVRARNNLGLPSLAAGQMWYAQGQDLLSVMDTTAMGRGLLNKGITLNAIWYGSATNTIGEIITSQVGRDVLVTTGASAVANLWATKATTDSRDSVIINTYGTDLAFDGNTLRLKNNASAKAFIGTGIETNANSGLVRLTGGKIPLSVFPDAILGQLTFGGNISSYDSTDDGLIVSLTGSAKAILEERSGKSLTDKVVVLVATSTKPADTGVYVFFNYADCKGMYFIWKDSALESHTGETAKYRIWPSGGPRYQAGDWMNSLETEWDKVDNTDAVTGVKGNAESVYRLGLVNITAQNVRALDTGLPNEIQNVQGKVEFEKDIWSLGGIAAYGVSDLSMGAGGGGGLSGSILRNWASYDPNDETQILGSNLGIESFRMSGAKFQFMRNKTWTDGFTLADSNIPDLPLTKITGTDDLRAIEALTGTGILKRTADNTWALRDAAGLRSDAGITGDIYTHNYSEFVTAVSISGTNLSVTKNGQATTTPINAATLQGHAADYFATQEAFDSAVSTLSGGIGQVLAMAQDNAENISLHDDRITDLESYFDGASVKNALTLEGYGASYFGTASAVSTLQGYFTNGVANNADKVDGHHASEFVGALGVSGNNLTWTRIGGTAQNITVPYATNAGTLGGVAKEGLFTVLENDDDQLSATIGTTNKKLTLDYAKRTSRMRTEIKADQEFVYRQSPQTIDADSLVINKFKGKTLVWNQLYPSLVAYVNCEVASAGAGKYTVTPTNSVTIMQVRNNSNMYLINGHKYINLFSILSGASTIGAITVALMSAVSGTVVQRPDANAIFTFSQTSGAYLFIYQLARNNTSDMTAVTVTAPVVVDLTLMFGAGNEPSTVAEFEAMFPEAYYPYNAGELRNNDAKAVETVGFNKYDEQWELGSIDGNGTPSTSTSGIRSKNYNRVLPNTQYYLYSPTQGGALVIYFYDSSLNMIPYTGIGVYMNGYNGGNGEFTTPAGAAYMRWRAANTYGTTYKNDICINLSDPNRNDTYEPYRKSTMPLNLNAIKVYSHNIWDEEVRLGTYNDSTGAFTSNSTNIANKNAINVFPNTAYHFYVTNDYYIWAYFYDENDNYLGYQQVNNATFTTPSGCRKINFYVRNTYGATYNNDICINESSSFNGRYEPHGILTIEGLKGAGSVYDEIVSNKLIKRMVRVNLGDAVWTKNTIGSNNVSYYRSSSFADIKNTAVQTDVPNIVSAKYVTVSQSVWLSSGDKIIFREQNSSAGVVDIRDDSYSTADAFKAAMDGVYADYELATPIEYELVSPIPDTMPAGTTERIISDRLPVTPFACDMTYGANPKDILASGIAWEKIWGRPILEKGLYSDATLTPAISTDDQNNTAWFKLPIGDTALYIKFAVGDKAFRLQVADDDMNPTVSKEFEFATLSTADINAICV